MRKWSHIIIHHSATMDSRTFSWSAIRRYHMIELGWSGIGYHFGIEQVEDFYEIMFGRSLERKGAHCAHAQMNSKAIGICMVGNWDEQPPTSIAMDLLVDLVVWLMEIYDIPLDNILRHHDIFAGKTCPGKAFPWVSFKQRIQVHLGMYPIVKKHPKRKERRSSSFFGFLLGRRRHEL